MCVCLWMRSTLVVKASDCQCRSRSPRFYPRFSVLGRLKFLILLGLYDFYLYQIDGYFLWDIWYRT
jgi:hypothetical protein